MTENREDMKQIMVCDNCLTASCWHGEFMCQESQGAGVKLMAIAELRAINQEHKENWGKSKLMKVYGTEAPFGYKEEATDVTDI